MSLDEQFEAAEKAIKTLTKRPTDEELLELYALFKQATIGDCNTEKPGLFDMKGKAKWQSWNNKKGVSKEDAKKAYIEWVNNLMEKYK
ncbi:acyl-CoA-binding protein homolog [Polistes fuscatus]|uniref:acyl-CoA-binding protein homolog n=1 Tax=Polistes fuscatus TaxID=30207 RepID=UPI001CA84D53|nr:acyl-CoA-binding protein homolog [Polistes fuscatus]XP_043493975.1 acyl-CoA-binding protein homolog [Polistes fuscatus]